MLLDFIISMQFTCLVRSRSRWFSGYLSWIIKQSETKEETEKNLEKKVNVLPSHLSLRTLKKPAQEAVQLIRGMRCYSSHFHPYDF